MADARVVPLSKALLEPLAAHLKRHTAESGRDGDRVFMPFEPGTDQGPSGIDPARWQLPLTQPGWQRWFVALSSEVSPEARVVGHLDLKGEALPTARHRCELGIGIERAYRGAGLGRTLMQRGIDFARAAPELDWLDLRVFRHNAPARALYEALGFTLLGMVPDRVRVAGQKIDDCLMTLPVSPEIDPRG
ncbi:MAG: GNAT family protein [Pseudomonadota bacterium]